MCSFIVILWNEYVFFDFFFFQKNKKNKNEENKFSNRNVKHPPCKIIFTIKYFSSLPTCIDSLWFFDSYQYLFFDYVLVFLFSLKSLNFNKNHTYGSFPFRRQKTDINNFKKKIPISLINENMILYSYYLLYYYTSFYYILYLLYTQL